MIDMHGIAVACIDDAGKPCAMLSKWTHRRLSGRHDVLAGKIKVAIVLSPIAERIPPTDHDVTIVLENGAEIGVSKTFIEYGIPGPGDYFVQKEHGRQQWVSRKAFEAQFMQS